MHKGEIQQITSPEWANARSQSCHEQTLVKSAFAKLKLRGISTILGFIDSNEANDDTEETSTLVQAETM